MPEGYCQLTKQIKEEKKKLILENILVFFRQLIYDNDRIRFVNYLYVTEGWWDVINKKNQYINQMCRRTKTFYFALVRKDSLNIILMIIQWIYIFIPRDLEILICFFFYYKRINCFFVF